MAAYTLADYQPLKQKGYSPTGSFDTEQQAKENAVGDEYLIIQLNKEQSDLLAKEGVKPFVIMQKKGGGAHLTEPSSFTAPELPEKVLSIEDLPWSSPRKFASQAKDLMEELSMLAEDGNVEAVENLAQEIFKMLNEWHEAFPQYQKQASSVPHGERLATSIGKIHNTLAKFRGPLVKACKQAKDQAIRAAKEAPTRLSPSEQPTGAEEQPAAPTPAAADLPWQSAEEMKKDFAAAEKQFWQAYHANDADNAEKIVRELQRQADEAEQQLTSLDATAESGDESIAFDSMLQTLDKIEDRLLKMVYAAKKMAASAQEKRITHRYGTSFYAHLREYGVGGF